MENKNASVKWLYCNENDDYDDYHLTGSEDEESYHYIIKNKKYKFYKTIIIYHDQDYDFYEQRFYFTEYYFACGKKIAKINKYELNKEFVKSYQCDISESNYHVWNIKKTCPIKYAPVVLDKPNDILKQFSEQLYDKYVNYYDKN